MVPFRDALDACGEGSAGENVEVYRSVHEGEAGPLLSALQDTARRRENMFQALMEAGKVCSLGSVSHALYEVGGEYRRNM